MVVYLDDILVTGKSEESHLSALDEVLCRLDKAGLRVKQNKCAFMRSSVSYVFGAPYRRPRIAPAAG